jgi:hypothetical protein
MSDEPKPTTVHCDVHGKSENPFGGFDCLHCATAYILLDMASREPTTRELIGMMTPWERAGFLLLLAGPLTCILAFWADVSLTAAGILMSLAGWLITSAAQKRRHKGG